MPKTFYTERDIEDLVNQGVRSIVVDDDVVLTDLAYDKARRLGVELLREEDKPPAAPERPYIAKKMTIPASKTTPQAGGTPGAETQDELHKRVYEAVIARLGDSVDPTLLDTIIQRVLRSIRTN